MPTAKDTPFKAYEFSPEEVPLAMVFTDLQKKHIQTELAVAAMEKMTLRVDPANLTTYLYECEYLRGKMEILSYLLLTSEAHESELLATMAEAVEAAAAENQSEQRGD